jgi:hypothetical protein
VPLVLAARLDDQEDRPRSRPGLDSSGGKLARLIEQRTPCLVVASPTSSARFDFRFYEMLWRNLDSELVVVDRSDEIGGRGGALEDLTDATKYYLSPSLWSQTWDGARRTWAGGFDGRLSV